MVLRRCRAMLYDEESAHDAMQEVFVRLIRRADMLTETHLGGLMYCMATNVCLNVIRTRRRKPESPDAERIELIADTDAGPDAVDANDMLNRIFEHEDASTRVIATLHYSDGFTLEATAKAAGLSVSGVRKRLRMLAKRARKLKEHAR